MEQNVRDKDQKIRTLADDIKNYRSQKTKLNKDLKVKTEDFEKFKQ